MTRVEFQRLAGVRLAEAETLLAAGLWDGAYYLAGYAVECGLKACTAKLTRAEEFPPKPEVVRDCYTHDFIKLVRAAGLTTALAAAVAADKRFRDNWSEAAKWSEQSRYESFTEAQARALFGAISDPVAGVLPWVRTHW